MGEDVAPGRRRQQDPHTDIGGDERRQGLGQEGGTAKAVGDIGQGAAGRSIAFKTARRLSGDTR